MGRVSIAAVGRHQQEPGFPATPTGWRFRPHPPDRRRIGRRGQGPQSAIEIERVETIRAMRYPALGEIGLVDIAGADVVEHALDPMPILVRRPIGGPGGGDGPVGLGRGGKIGGASRRPIGCAGRGCRARRIEIGGEHRCASFEPVEGYDRVEQAQHQIGRAVFARMARRHILDRTAQSS